MAFLRYFNRVKTGYDWNKYNQTHYDHDNPPPKSVQGYKFNIFYPDLIDRSRTPGYVLEPAVSACAARSALCLWFRVEVERLVKRMKSEALDWAGVHNHWPCM